jgi:hypothetical protein
MKANSHDLTEVISRHLSEETEDKQENLNRRGRYPELDSDLIFRNADPDCTTFFTSDYFAGEYKNYSFLECDVV